MARWTDLAEWVGPTANQSGKMLEHRGLVIHTAEGYYLGTIAWQRNPDANVSSHFILAGPRDVAKGVPDGKLAQMVDTDITAWTQRSGNGHWLSVECSGFGSKGEKLSAAQCESVARLLARAHRDYGVPLQLAVNPDGRGLGHHSMGCNWPAGAWGHCDCPGDQIIAQKPAILARAKEIVNGDDMSVESDKKIDDLHYAMFSRDTADRPSGSQSRDAKQTLATVQAVQAQLKAQSDQIAELAKAVAALAEAVKPLPPTITITGGELRVGTPAQ